MRLMRQCEAAAMQNPNSYLQLLNRKGLKQQTRQAFDDEVQDLKRLLKEEMRKRKCDPKVTREMSDELDSRMERQRSEWLHGAQQTAQIWFVGSDLRNSYCSYL